MTRGQPLRVRVAPLGAVGLVALALLLLAGVGRAQPSFPQLTGRVVDGAGLLSVQEKTVLIDELAALETKSTDQLVVVTLNSLQGYPIEDFGYQLGRHWGIGQKGKDNGVLLIVAPNERKVRIEVGRGLEPVLTDGMSKLIIDNAILPRFREGDFPAGIRAGVRDIKDVLLGDTEAVKQRAIQQQRSNQPDTLQIVIFLFWLAIVLFVMWAIFRSSFYGQPANVRRRGGPAVIPGSSDHWGSGGWSGGGGGGWSGGGGGFGGGGSSGSW